MTVLQLLETRGSVHRSGASTLPAPCYPSGILATGRFWKRKMRYSAVAMSPRAWVITGFALLLGSVVIWTLIPPFPPSLLLLEEPLPLVTTKFGPPNGIAPTIAVLWHPARSLVWEKSRGIGVWILQVDWDKTLPTAAALPDSVSRTLRVLGLLLPGDAAVRATVWVPARRPDQQARH
jgi:hypothetical protein